MQPLDHLLCRRSMRATPLNVWTSLCRALYMHARFINSTAGRCWRGRSVMQQCRQRSGLQQLQLLLRFIMMLFRLLLKWLLLLLLQRCLIYISFIHTMSVAVVVVVCDVVLGCWWGLFGRCYRRCRGLRSQGIVDVVLVVVVADVFTVFVVVDVVVAIVVVFVVVVVVVVVIDAVQVDVAAVVVGVVAVLCFLICYCLMRVDASFVILMVTSMHGNSSHITSSFIKWTIWNVFYWLYEISFELDGTQFSGCYNYVVQRSFIRYHKGWLLQLGPI